MQDDFYRRFGKRIAEMRRQLVPPVTQDQLAERLGMSRSSVANIEKGRQRCLLHTLVELADAIGCEPAALLPEKPSHIESEVVRELGQKGLSDALGSRVAKHIISEEGTTDEP